MSNNINPHTKKPDDFEDHDANKESQQEFRMSKGSKLFLLAFSVAIIAIFIIIGMFVNRKNVGKNNDQKNKQNQEQIKEHTEDENQEDEKTGIVNRGKETISGELRKIIGEDAFKELKFKSDRRELDKNEKENNKNKNGDNNEDQNQENINEEVQEKLDLPESWIYYNGVNYKWAPDLKVLTDNYSPMLQQAKEDLGRIRSPIKEVQVQQKDITDKQHKLFIEQGFIGAYNIPVSKENIAYANRVNEDVIEINLNSYNDFDSLVYVKEDKYQEKELNDLLSKKETIAYAININFTDRDNPSISKPKTIDTKKIKEENLKKITQEEAVQHIKSSNDKFAYFLISDDGIIFKTFIMFQGQDKTVLADIFESGDLFAINGGINNYFKEIEH